MCGLPQASINAVSEGTSNSDLMMPICDPGCMHSWTTSLKMGFSLTKKKKRHFQLWALDKKPVFVYRFWKHVLHYLLKLVSFLSHRAALRKEKDTIDSQSTPQIKPSSTRLHCHWEKVILPCKKKNIIFLLLKCAYLTEFLRSLLSILHNCFLNRQNA